MSQDPLARWLRILGGGGRPKPRFGAAPGPKPRYGAFSGPAPAPEPRFGFKRLWRTFLPISIAAILAAILTGAVDSGSGPAWLFGVGLVFAAIGVASYVVALMGMARAKVEDLIDDDSAPPPPNTSTRNDRR